MLKMKPNCECCDRDLPPGSVEARICSFECTFCSTCAEAVFNGHCPNCGGNFAARPTRAEALLARNPPSSERFLRPRPCPGTSSGASALA